MHDVSGAKISDPAGKRRKGRADRSMYMVEVPSGDMCTTWSRKTCRNPVSLPLNTSNLSQKRTLSYSVEGAWSHESVGSRSIAHTALTGFIAFWFERKRRGFCGRVLEKSIVSNSPHRICVCALLIEAAIPPAFVVDSL